MENSYNSRCPAVKRLLREAQELHEATEEYFAQPLEDNLFEWHFTVRGPSDTEFEGGIYHGRIILPPEYPMKPPNIIFYTPNGRFEANKKICLSISGHHPETWQPSWSIRTALLAIIGFMPTAASGTIGALDYTASERSILAKKSVEFICVDCGTTKDLLKERTGSNTDFQREAREVCAQMDVTSKTENGEKEEANKRQGEKLEEDVVSNNMRVGENSMTKQPTEFTNNTSAVLNSTSTATFQSSTTSLHETSRQPSSSSALSLWANNLILSSAVFLLIALVFRRLFLLESDASEDVEEILL